MKKSMILILILVGVLICSWHRQANAQYRELTVQEKRVLRGVEELSQAGAVLSKYIGPATATVEVLHSETDIHKKGLLFGNGSCVFISSHYALTNWHVVKKFWETNNDDTFDIYNNLRMRIAYSATEKGEIEYYKAVLIDGLPAGPDYALLKVEGREFPYLSLGNSDDIESGNLLFAVGSPFNCKYSFMVLTVSTVAPTIPDYSKKNFNLIQVAGTMNPGTSGGPAVNTKGELIGLMVGVLTNEDKLEGDDKLIKSINNTSIGFITPINLAKDFIRNYVPELK